MIRRKTKTVCVKIKESTKDLMQTMADRQGIPLSTLLRLCTFTDFQDDTAEIRGIDVFEFSEAIDDISRNMDIFSEVLMNYGGLYSEQVKELNEKQIYFEKRKKEIYEDMEKIRVRIKKYCVKKMLDAQAGFAETEVLQGEPSKTQVRLFEEEYEQLKKEKEETGQAMSDILKNNMISKCIAQDIVVDSYPLDDTTEEIKRAGRLIKAVVQEANARGVTGEDVQNVMSAVSSIEDAVNRVVIPWEQKETRKEATRVLNKAKIR